MTFTVALSLFAYMRSGFGSPNELMKAPSESPVPASTPQTSPVASRIPAAILDPILKEAAKLANVSIQQLVIARADAVVWNDGSLGCPEEGIEYAQMLTNGYWVVINAARQTYDFRVGRDGSFRLCPLGRGHPPLPSDTQ